MLPGRASARLSRQHSVGRAATKRVGASGAGPGPNAVRPYEVLENPRQESKNLRYRNTARQRGIQGVTRRVPMLSLLQKVSAYKVYVACVRPYLPERLRKRLGRWRTRLLHMTCVAPALVCAVSREESWNRLSFPWVTSPLRRPNNTWAASINSETLSTTDLGWGARHQSGCSHAALLWARRSQKSSKQPLRRQHRRAMMALAPRRVQCIPARLSRVPTVTLQPASTTPEEVHKPWA